MTRKFKTADYDATLNLTIRLAEALPPNHLARFIVDVIAQLDVSQIYARYAPVGGEPIEPAQGRGSQTESHHHQDQEVSCRLPQTNGPPHVGAAHLL